MDSSFFKLKSWTWIAKFKLELNSAILGLNVSWIPNTTTQFRLRDEEIQYFEYFFFSPVLGALSLMWLRAFYLPQVAWGLVFCFHSTTTITTAEEVINSLENSLENMKLTLEEEEVIAISDEGWKEEIESFSLSLIGKFLTCKTFNKKGAHNTLRRAWGLSDGLQIIEVGSNLFQFKFKIEFELEQVWKRGPWTFDNQVLMLRRWQSGMTAKNV